MDMAMDMDMDMDMDTNRDMNVYVCEAEATRPANTINLNSMVYVTQRLGLKGWLHDCLLQIASWEGDPKLEVLDNDSCWSLFNRYKMNEEYPEISEACKTVVQYYAREGSSNDCMLEALNIVIKWYNMQQVCNK
jgi:hypothetical protein